MSDRIRKEWLNHMKNLPNKDQEANPRSLVTCMWPHNWIWYISSCVPSDNSSLRGVSRELIAAKLRLAKKNLTIPRLELVDIVLCNNAEPEQQPPLALDFYQLRNLFFS